MKKTEKLIFIGLCILLVGVLYSFTVAETDGEPWKVPEKYKKMENPTSSDEESLMIGKQLYKKHCASCHGKKGLGDGKKAAELETEVSDLTTEEFKAQLPGEKYYEAFIGRDDMPNFEKKIKDEEERWFVINYIDTF